MRFTDSDDFVAWLIGAITHTSTVEQMARSIEALRSNATARPRWSEELAFWERVTDPMLELAVAHEQVGVRRREVATVRATAATVVADADATTACSPRRKTRQPASTSSVNSARKDASMMQRRAQAHRLRMQLRAAKLRADAAEEAAKERCRVRDEAVRALAAWQMVAGVHEARLAASTLSRLEERLDTAEKETSALRRHEQQYRDQLARLLTHRRDQAAGAFAAADRERERADKDLNAAEQAWQGAVAEHATVTEKERKGREEEAQSEQVIAEAVAAGLLTEGTRPADRDKFLAGQAESARQAAETAKEALRGIDSEIAAQRQAAETARKNATRAEADADGAQRRLDDVNRRVRSLSHDERLLDIAGELATDLWTARTSLTDLLQQAANSADADAAEARRDTRDAQRTIDSVGEDGLLPGSVLADETRTHHQGHARRYRCGPGGGGSRIPRRPRPPQRSPMPGPRSPPAWSSPSPACWRRRWQLPDGATRYGGLDWCDRRQYAAAMTSRPGTDDGTCGQVLLPHPGTYDRAAADEMLIAARDALADARQREQTATLRGTNARHMLAALTQLWDDLTEDPRPGLEEKIRTARERHQAAADAENTATEKLDYLARQHADRLRDQDQAQRTVDQSTETRRRLAPAVTAASALDQLRKELPDLRLAVSESRRRVQELAARKMALNAKLADLTQQARVHSHLRDDAAEALRAAGLSAITAGPVPDDDELTIRARLEAVGESIAEKAVDPGLHEQAAQARRQLADLNSRLDARPDIRQLAEEYADTDGARHPVALERSINEAIQREAEARQEYGRAQAAAETAASQYRQRSDERPTDRTSPDVEGFPADREVTVPADADRYAERLDELANEMGNTARAEEQAAREAAETAESASHDLDLVEASIGQLRYLADPAISGQPAGDAAELRRRLASIAERVRQSGEQLTASVQAEESAARKIRAYANGPEARKIEEAGDPRMARPDREAARRRATSPGCRTHRRPA